MLYGSWGFSLPLLRKTWVPVIGNHYSWMLVRGKRVSLG